MSSHQYPIPLTIPLHNYEILPEVEIQLCYIQLQHYFLPLDEYLYTDCAILFCIM